MSYYNPTEAYFENSVETQTPGNLVIKLYEGAIRFLYLAEEGFEIPQGQRLIKYSQINENILKAQAIINELRGTLNHDGGDVAKNLDSLYDYMYRTLNEANFKKGTDKDLSLKKLIEVRSFLEELLESWYQII